MSNLRLYRISGDNGKSWTLQWLTDDEAKEETEKSGVLCELANHPLALYPKDVRKNILYHATFRTYLRSILKHGLDTRLGQRNLADSENGVCLADDSEVAASFCETAEETPSAVYQSGIVVLTIDCTGLDLKPDNNIRGAGETGCYICYTAIPASRIIRYNDYT